MPLQTETATKKPFGFSSLSFAGFLVCMFLVVTKILHAMGSEHLQGPHRFSSELPSPGSDHDFFSLYGREVVWAVVMIALGLSKKQTHRRVAFYLVLTLFATAIPGYLTKFAISRLRPFQVFPNLHYLLPRHRNPVFPRDTLWSYVPWLRLCGSRWAIRKWQSCLPWMR